ncbi:MAG: hypothetical protein ACOX0E_09415 [Syntrophomonadaceae bacterium]
MKRTLFIFSLLVLIAFCVNSGTFALYTTTIDTLAAGSVVAKEFILVEGGTDSFTENVKIAPTETKTMSFSVKNYDGTIISETAMDLDFTVTIAAADGKDAIDPLEVTVMKGENVLGTKTGTGTLTFVDEFTLSELGQEHTYDVKIEWPSNNAVDIDFAGADFGSAVTVSVTGTQK